MGRPEGLTDHNLTDFEKAGIERMNNFKLMGSGYMMEHGTRPSTIGLVLSTNPVALLAWLVDKPFKKAHRSDVTSCRIGEKFVEWTGDPLAPEHILESVTLYWLTETFPRSIYTYRQVRYSKTPYPVNDLTY